MKKLLFIILLLPFAAIAQPPEWVGGPLKNTQAMMSLIEQRLSIKFTAYVTEKALAGIFYQVGLEEQQIRKDPAHNIGVSVIEPDGYKVEANVWLRADNYQILKLELQERMVDNLKHAGIKLPGMP